jgi:glycosyltransferase involved in cell wall biosynthesis
MESNSIEASCSTGRIWITWETQRRNQNLAKAFNARFIQFDYAANRILRYLVLPFKTISAYRKTRPRLIFSQNPSLVLAFLTILYGKFKGIKIIVDSHNAGIRPLNGEKWILNVISNYIIRHADITIVTNDKLATLVKSKGGRPFVLPDRIPNFEGYLPEKLDLRGRFKVFFICTFADDEPFLEVIGAGKLLEKNTVIYISGNPKSHIGKIKADIPDNVVPTGYLPEEEYLRMMSSCDLILDLTTREDCLVCGAYEALGMGKPMLLSDTAVNREYFRKGVLYTDNSSRDIAEKIQIAMRSIGEMTEAVKDLKDELMDGWEQKRAALEDRLERL